MATTLTPAPAAAPPLPEAPLYRLTVKQYHAMAEAGILGEGAPVELIEGVLVQKMTKSRRHVTAVERLYRALDRAMPAGWHVEAQPAITTAEYSEPEPDAAVIRGTLEDYAEHPQASALGLVVEVSDSSLRQDRRDKKRVYARAGIPVYWIVNLNARIVEVYTDPTGDAQEPDYRTRRDYGAGESVPLVLDGETVGALAVSDLLP